MSAGICGLAWSRALRRVHISTTVGITPLTDVPSTSVITPSRVPSSFTREVARLHHQRIRRLVQPVLWPAKPPRGQSPLDGRPQTVPSQLTVLNSTNGAVRVHSTDEEVIEDSTPLRSSPRQQPSNDQRASGTALYVASPQSRQARSSVLGNPRMLRTRYFLRHLDQRLLKRLVYATLGRNSPTKGPEGVRPSRLAPSAWLAA